MKLKAGELGTTLFELAPCAVVVVDRDYNIVAANPAFRDSYGQWEGSHCYEVFKRQHRPCSRCAALDTFRDGQIHVTEERGFNKEGKQTFFEVKTAPLFDASGDVELVLEMTIDISAVKDLESRYRLLFERVPCFITLLDRDYRIADANWRHRETFGHTAERCHQVYMQSAEPCEECPVRRTFEDGRVHTQQKKVLDKHGRPIDLIVHSAPLYDRYGKIETVIEMATDITPMVEMQNRLLLAEGDAAMDRAIDVLTTTLEQLLAGFSEIGGVRAALGQAGAPEAGRALEAVEHRIAHLEVLLAVMTAYRRQRERPPAGSVELATLLADVVRLLRERPAGKPIPILTEIDDRLPPVRGDAATLRDSLACLVYDFLEVSRPPQASTGQVLLSARTDDRGEGVVLRIGRRGLALVGDEGSSITQGMSMSLLVVKRTIEAGGGRVEFCSSKGQGVSFTVHLPPLAAA